MHGARTALQQNTRQSQQQHHKQRRYACNTERFPPFIQRVRSRAPAVDAYCLSCSLGVAACGAVARLLRLSGEERNETGAALTATKTLLHVNQQVVHLQNTHGVCACMCPVLVRRAIPCYEATWIGSKDASAVAVEERAVAVEERAVAVAVEEAAAALAAVVEAVAAVAAVAAAVEE